MDPPGHASSRAVEINTVTETRRSADGELHILGLRHRPGARRSRPRSSASAVRAGAHRADARPPPDAGHAGRRPAPRSSPLRRRVVGRPTMARAIVAAGLRRERRRRLRPRARPGRAGYVPREGWARAAIDAIRGPAACPSWPTSPRPPSAGLPHRAPGCGPGWASRSTTGLRRGDRRRMVAWRPRTRLVATGGSDYHGDEMPYAEATAETWVPPAVAAVLAALGRARAGR